MHHMYSNFHPNTFAMRGILAERNVRTKVRRSSGSKYACLQTYHHFWMNVARCRFVCFTIISVCVWEGHGGAMCLFKLE